MRNGNSSKAICAASLITHRPCRPVEKKMIHLLPEGALRRTTAVAAAVVAVALAGCADMASMSLPAKMGDSDSLGLTAPASTQSTAAVASPKIDRQWWVGLDCPRVNAS